MKTDRRSFLSSALSSSMMLPAVAAAAAAQGGNPVFPRKAPELAIKLPGGREVLLSSFRGKVVGIEFLFTTCPHCQETSKTLTRLTREYGPRGFQPLGAAFNDMAMLLVPDFINMTGASYPVGVVGRQTVLDFLQYPDDRRLMVPVMAFIDRAGMIRTQSPLEPPPGFDFHAEPNLRKIIEGLLNDSAGGSAGQKKAAPAKKK